mgnify:CR=1 FL=1
MSVTTREHIAFGGSYLINGALFVSHLYDLEDGSYGWELMCVDHEGNRTMSRLRKFHPDLDSALIWTLYRVLDYALSLGIQPDDLQILQRSCSPDCDPEFIAAVLRTAHEARTEVRH